MEKRRSRGLLGRLTPEERERAYTYAGDITCGPTRGFVEGLTPEQFKAAMELDGDDTIGTWPPPEA